MRVLTIGSERFAARPGGLNRYLESLTDALHEVDVETEVLFPGEWLAGSGLPGPIRTIGRVVLATWQAARRLGAVDLVDSHFALYGLGPVLVAHARRVPVVVHFQGPWAEESALAGVGSVQARAVKRIVERAVYRRAAAVVVLSDAFADRVVRDYGVDRERVHVLRPGVDHDRFAPSDGAREPVPTVVAARRLDPRMGLDVAVAAWPAVVAAVPEARLVVAGEGASRDDLESQARDLGVDHRVTFLGRVTDARLLELYQRAHLSIVPTRAMEGFGLVALESLAAGTPVVVTDVDALPECVGRLDPSLVVPADDPAALAARVVAALAGDVPTAAACARFAAGFTWERAAREHADLFREVTGGRRPDTAATVVVLALEWPAPDSGGGGVARHNWRTAHALAAAGHRVVVVTAGEATPSDRVEVRPVRVGAGRLGRYYLAPWRAAREVRRAGGDVIVAGGDDWALWGTRRVRIYHGTARSEARHSTGIRRLNHQVIRGIEYLSALDPTARAFAVGPDVPRRSMRVTHLPPVAGVVLTPPAELPGPTERSGLVFVGPWSGRKRGDIAERVVEHLRTTGDDVALTVFTAHSEEARHWGPDTRVVVAAGDDEVRDALHRARFLLSTSSYEGFGIPAVEALAAGCLPVSTRTPGAEAVLTGPLAALLGPVDPDAFARFAADTVRDLGRDDVRYLALQRAGNARVRELLELGDPLRLIGDDADVA